MESEDIKNIDFSDALLYQESPPHTAYSAMYEADKVDSVLDEKINTKVIQGIKKAMSVLTNNLDKHIQNKVRLLLKDEVRA